MSHPRYALPQPFRDLDHVADVAVEVDGASAEEALARLVLAEAALLAGGGAVRAEREAIVTAAGPDLRARAVGLLRELLFRFATEGLLAAWCEVEALGPDEARVRVGLGRRDAALHGEGLDLKAVTWHLAALEEAAGRWMGRAVFDI